MNAAIAQPSTDLGPKSSLTGPVAPGAAGIAFGLGNVPPTAILLLAIVSVQLGAALATVLFSSLGAIGTAFLSAFFSALVLTLVQGRKAVSPGAVAALGRHKLLLLGLGVTCAAMVLPFFLALQTIPLGIASTITFLGPLGVAVATSRRLVHFLWIAVAASGIALLTPLTGAEIGAGSGGLDPIGLCYAAIAAVAWGSFVLLTKRAVQHFPGVGILGAAQGVAALLLLPLALAEGSLFQAGFADVAGALLVSLLSEVLPIALDFAALQRMSTRTYGILVTLEPAVGALVGVVCLGQPAEARMLIALGCVMLAALGVTLSDRRESE